MKEVERVESSVKGLDKDAAQRASLRLDRLTKPKGSLGKLEDLAIKIAGIAGELEPILEERSSLVFAGDHGVVEEGVSAYPKEVTVQMLANFVRDKAAINVLAEGVGSEVLVVDVGVDSDEIPPGVVERKVSRGTKNFTLGAAMTREQALASIRVGYEIVEELAEDGLDLLGLGDMGIGNTTPSSAITAVMTGSSPSDVTGRGTGIDEKSLKKKVRVVKKGLSINSPEASAPIGVLTKVGGYEIGALAGGFLAGASNRVPLLVDGFISSAAALIAQGLVPEVADYMVACHCSSEPGHILALKRLGLEPLLDLNLCLGEGTGTALAMPLVEAAVALLNRMDTFAEAGVNGRGKTVD